MPGTRSRAWYRFLTEGQMLERATQAPGRGHTLGMFQIHAAVFLFGFAGLFGKFLHCSPLYIVLGRTFFASLTLWGYARLVSRIRLGGVARTDLFFFILQGILLAAHWVLFFLAIQVSSVAVGLVSFSSFPLFVTFMEPLFFKERLKPVDMATALAVFAGILLVVPDIDLSNRVTLGAFLGVLSGLTFAFLGLVNRRNVKTCDAVAVAFYQNAFAALILIVPIFALGPPVPDPAALPKLLALGVVFTALAHTWFIRSLAVIRVQTASVIAGLEPVYGIIFAFVLLNEQPEISTLAGGLLIIGATIAAGIVDRKKNESFQT